jgi:hypothetical protein
MTDSTDGWEKVGTGGKVVKLGEVDKGYLTSVSGIYRGKRDGEFGPLYDLEQPDGSFLVLAHNSAIGYKLEDYEKGHGAAPLGKEVRFTYLGMKTPKGGGKDYKDIDMEFRDPGVPF